MNNPVTKRYAQATEAVEIDLKKVGKHALGTTKGVALLSRHNMTHAGRTDIFLDYNCATSFPIDANELDGPATVGDLLTERTREAMRRLAAEIYANIRPWLDETPEPRVAEVSSLLCCPQVELMP